MGAEREKRVWERIAELGFADAVESKGFKRVGKTHWRLDGDGIVHHVKLYRGFAIEPGSFRDFSGICFPAIDELCRKIDERPPGSKVPYGTAHCHLEGTIYDAYCSSEVRRFQKMYPEPGPPKGLLEKTKALLFVPRRPHFEREFFRPLPCYEERTTVDAGSGAWLTRNRDIQDVADVVTRTWLDYDWPDTARWPSFHSFYEERWKEQLEDRSMPDTHDFLFARLAEDWGVIERMAGKVFADTGKNFETELHELTRHRLRVVSNIDWKTYIRTDKGQRHMRRDAMVRVVSPLKRARRLLQHSVTLGYGIKDPGIDFGPLIESEKDPGYFEI
ncbi:MAG: hypothetical protein TEF_20535 [Rhizobiales bacterium NRL2]|jgi:hypothetical protein|nr:MAG: hypothetical protein TEF_20535 [Rhizobiales bacterium NRL2]